MLSMASQPSPPTGVRAAEVLHQRGRECGRQLAAGLLPQALCHLGVCLRGVTSCQPHHRQHSILGRHCARGRVVATCSAKLWPLTTAHDAHPSCCCSCWRSCNADGRGLALKAWDTPPDPAPAPVSPPPGRTSAIVDGGAVVERLQRRTAHMRRASQQALQRRREARHVVGGGGSTQHAQERLHAVSAGRQECSTEKGQ